MAISDRPPTNVLAKVYQLYMVEYQCASMLISHNQGMVEATVSANHTRNKAAHTVFLKMYRLPLSTSGRGLLSSSRERLLILYPSTIHRPMVRMVHITKKPGFRKALLPSNFSSPFGVSQG